MFNTGWRSFRKKKKGRMFLFGKHFLWVTLSPLFFPLCCSRNNLPLLNFCFTFILVQNSRGLLFFEKTNFFFEKKGEREKRNFWEKRIFWEKNYSFFKRKKSSLKPIWKEDYAWIQAFYFIEVEAFIWSFEVHLLIYHSTSSPADKKYGSTLPTN